MAQLRICMLSYERDLNVVWLVIEREESNVAIFGRFCGEVTIQSDRTGVGKESCHYVTDVAVLVILFTSLIYDVVATSNKSTCCDRKEHFW